MAVDYYGRECNYPNKLCTINGVLTCVYAGAAAAGTPGAVEVGGRWWIVPTCPGSGPTQPPPLPPPGPNILPPVETTGGAGSIPAPVHVPGSGCQRCLKPSNGAQLAYRPPVPATAATPTATAMAGVPWWVWVLVALVLYQSLGKRHG